MVYLHNICKREAGSSGGTNFKIENGDDPIFQILTGNKFALMYFSVMGICNEIKTKASLLQ